MTKTSTQSLPTANGELSTLAEALEEQTARVQPLEADNNKNQRQAMCLSLRNYCEWIIAVNSWPDVLIMAKDDCEVKGSTPILAINWPAK